MGVLRKLLARLAAVANDLVHELRDRRRGEVVAGHRAFADLLAEAWSWPGHDA